MGVKIDVFDFFSYFGLYFLAESALLDGFHTKGFIFEGFVEFQFFVFAKWTILLKNGYEGAVQFYTQISTQNLLCKISTLTVIITWTLTKNLSSLA